MSKRSGNSSPKGPTVQYGDVIELVDESAPVVRWVKQQIDDVWCARIEFLEREGRLEAKRLEIFSTQQEPDGLPAAGGLLGRHVNKVRVQVCRDYAQQVALHGRVSTPILGMEMQFGAELVAKPRRPGPKRRPIAEDLCLARAYVEELARGPSGVNVRVARRLGETYGADYVAKRVFKLREGHDALLTTTSRGKAGGELTDYARMLLRQAQQTSIADLRQEVHQVKKAAIDERRVLDFSARQVAIARAKGLEILLARVAVTYERALTERQHPNSAIYEELKSKSSISFERNSVPGLVRAARAAGYLTPAIKGRASGRATTAAHALVNNR
jgi:hypothetical protein